MNSAPAILSGINELEDFLLYQNKLPKVAPLTRHYFSKGLYCREMAIPAGTAMTGATHKQDHICVIAQGSCDIASEEFTSTVTAPYIYSSKAGSKRAIYAHTDLVWITMHATEETDINILEQTLVE